MAAFFFEFYEGLRNALQAIYANKLRSMLTTLGIIIGIVSVTAMFTTINGIERGFDQSMAMIGNNVLHVQRWPWFQPSNEWWRFANRPPLTEELAELIAERSRYAVAVAPIAQTARGVSYRNRSLEGVFIQASTPDFSRVTNLNLTTGRFYNAFDQQTARNVCVIGAEVAEKLFPNERPIGKQVYVGGQRMEVIGVLDKQGKFLGLFSFDSQIQIPLATFNKLFGTRREGVSIQVRVASADAIDAAEDELTGLLRAARRQSPLQEDNFSINRNEMFRAQFAGIKLMIYGVGLFLTALSLLVGGIGVMNIMFVSVRERTKEIGIRKAIGAPSRAILTQFLLEAILICTLGGVIGIALSAAVAAVINQFFTAYLSPATVMLAFSICVAVGILFGFIPARSAARANPIEALRYE